MKPQDILTLNLPPVILTYGPAGTGKTGLVAQAKNGYCFDFDSGMRTAATLKDKFFDQRQGIEFDIYKESNPKTPEMYHKAMVKLQEINQACRNNTWKHDAVIVDSITGLAEIIKLKVMKDSGGDALKKPEMNHWGQMVNYMESFLIQLRSLRKLILITAHIQNLNDKEGQLINIFPSSITKNHGMKGLPWMVDELWYAQVLPEGMGKYGYYINGQNMNQTVTRTRTNIGKVKHSEIGLVKLLEIVGYKYGETK